MEREGEEVPLLRVTPCDINLVVLGWIQGRWWYPHCEGCHTVDDTNERGTGRRLDKAGTVPYRC